MPRVKFVENKYIRPPYVGNLVRFNEYGEEKEINEAAAIHLLKSHPYAFKSRDITIEELEPAPKNLVSIRFLRNKYLDSYRYGAYTFGEPGDVLKVDEASAKHMLTVHYDKFEIVDDDSDDGKKKEISESDGDVEVESDEIEVSTTETDTAETESDNNGDDSKGIEIDDNGVIQGSIFDGVKSAFDTTGKDLLKISEIANAIGVEWQTIRKHIEELVDAGRLSVIEEDDDTSGYKAKKYKLAV